MEVESKYIVSRTGAFSAMLAAEALGQYRLEALDSTPVRDTYVDTEAADLLNQGYVFRIREQGGATQATLKSMGGVEGPLHRRLEIETAIDQTLDEEGHLDLPEGLLRDTLDQLIDDHPLLPSLELRQYRSPRIVFDGARMVGVLTMDVIAVETEIGPEISHQIEVELSEDGEEADIYSLDPILRERGMEPTSSSKFERGLVLLQRSPAKPLALLPFEQETLRRFQEEGTPLFRRRARVVLLAARGLHPNSIAGKVGLSHLRVEHWIDAFRKQRTAIFDEGTVDVLAARGESKVHPFSISELISEGPPVPALFPAEVAAGTSWRAHAPSFEYDVSAVSEFGSETITSASEVVRHEEIELKRHTEEPGGGEGSSDKEASTAPYLKNHPKSAPPSPLPTADLADATTIEYDEIRLVTEPPPALPTDPSAKHRGEAAEFAETISEEAHEELADAPSISGGPVEIPSKPILKAGDSVLSAAERVFRYQYAWQADAANRVLETSGEPRSIRRLLVGVHRLRIALQLFKDYLPPQPVNRLHKGLRGLARSLDVVGDLDHVISHITSAQADAPESEALGFEPVLATLNSERTAAWDASHVRLNSSSRAQWSRRFETLLARLSEQVADGVEADDFTPSEPDNYLEGFADLPKRTRLQDMLGSAVWRRYEGLRAFDTSDGALTDEMLHPFGVACASMQYILALTSSCAAESVRGVSRPMVGIESHLAVLHHARLTADALTSYSDIEGVADLRTSLQSLQKDMLKEAFGLWRSFVTPDYRQSLARVVASL